MAFAVESALIKAWARVAPTTARCHRMTGAKCLLQPREILPRTESLDGRHVAAVRFDCEAKTGLDDLAVEGDRARATRAFVAANSWTGQAGLIAKKIDQQGPHFNGALQDFPIHGNRDVGLREREAVIERHRRSSRSVPSSFERSGPMRDASYSAPSRKHPGADRSA